MDAHYIFHPSTIWVRPLFTELGPKNPHFAKNQTNICRLSGDIKIPTLLLHSQQGSSDNSSGVAGIRFSQLCIDIFGGIVYIGKLVNAYR